MSQPENAEIWSVVLQNRLEALRDSTERSQYWRRRGYVKAPIRILSWRTKYGDVTIKESAPRREAIRLASLLCKLERCCRFFRVGTDDSGACWKYLAANTDIFKGCATIARCNEETDCVVGVGSPGDWSTDPIMVFATPISCLGRSLGRKNVIGVPMFLAQGLGGGLPIGADATWGQVRCLCSDDELGPRREEIIRHRKVAVAHALNPFCNCNLEKIVLEYRADFNHAPGTSAGRREVAVNELRRQISVVSALMGTEFEDSRSFRCTEQKGPGPGNVFCKGYEHWHDFWHNRRVLFLNFERLVKREPALPIKEPEKRKRRGNRKGEEEIERPSKRGKKDDGDKKDRFFKKRASK